MSQPVSIEEILADLPEKPLLDVRSPGEFAQGHVPGAVSFPLFEDAERAEVGTLYKQVGPQNAMLRGLEFVGPKMADFVRQAGEIAPNRVINVHCWRGGQRSGSVAWLLRTAGFAVKTMTGGYKNYRQAALQFFEKTDFLLVILGGRTGSGKTKVLQKLAALGEQILDLEALAHHKGSAFGALGEAEQPTVEQFENDLFSAASQLDFSRRIWVENESHAIGRVFIPTGFWKKMKVAPLINLEIPLAERVKNLCFDYADQPTDGLRQAFKNIERKLGGQHLKTALEALDHGEMALAAEIALHYYDKTYQHCLETNTSPLIRNLEFAEFEPTEIAIACISLANEFRFEPLTR